MKTKVGSEVYCFQDKGNVVFQYVGKVTDVYNEFINIEFYGRRKALNETFEQVEVKAVFKKLESFEGHYVNGELGEAIVIA